GVSYVLLALLDADRGIVNQIIRYFGNASISWYNEPKYWHIILVTIYIWKMAGYGAVIYYAGLMGTSKEYYEAAKIDGANKLQEIWYISLPALRPMITILTILALGRILNGDIGLFYNVTLDSPLLYPATDVIDTYVFRAVKGMTDIGLTSAVSLYQSVCGFILIMIVNTVVRKINEDESLF
ncbi:MAG TPA: ABC transporter permease subunit, partial [Clostridium sp.]